MYPTATFIPRYSLKEFEFAGRKIPTNNAIMGFEPLSHYPPKRPTKPYTFDPLRFSPECAEGNITPINMCLLAAALISF